MLDLDWAVFTRKLHEEWGFDLTAYKQEQLRRRIGHWQERRSLRSLHDLLRALRKSPEERRAFLDYLWINTTEFYRDPAVFDALWHKTLPEIAQRASHIRVWSAACSSGAEPYTLAMLLHDLGCVGRYSILATDIDDEALQMAEAGVYPTHYLAKLPKKLAEAYTEPAGENSTRVLPQVRQGVRFKRHDLLSDRYETGFHLILCRNVFIYFTAETQQRVLKQMVQSLFPRGYIVLGGTETIFEPAQLGLERCGAGAYRRIDA